MLSLTQNEIFLLKTGICINCYALLRPIKGKRCEKCGLPLISEMTVCLRCRERSYHFKQHIPLFYYKGPVKDLIYFYKFKQKRTLALLFSYFINNITERTFPNLPLIPVPSRNRVFKKHDWGHLAPVMKLLKNNYTKVVIDCLERRGDTPQKKLLFNERLENLHGKIFIKQNTDLSYYPDVVLIDDIFTTGATLDECARILLSIGVNKVYAVTVAID